MSTHDPVRFIAKNMRVDLALIAEIIAPRSRVLDIGCGDGALIDYLFQTKQCDARGIEIDMAEVTRAVAHGRWFRLASCPCRSSCPLRRCLRERPRPLAP